MRCPPSVAAALREMARRQRVIDSIDAAAFEKQRGFVRDEAHKQYLLCPRRAGKSVGDCLKLFRTACKFDGVRCVYVGLTRGSAKKVLWDELKNTAQRLGLMGDPAAKVPPTCVFREAELIVRFANGSTIELVGMDADKNQRAKALGGKYKIVIVDEAASYRVDLRALMRDFFEPATTDQRGMIVMTGTPDPDEARGFFYEVTNDKVGGWAKHTWDTLDNPHMKVQWQERLDAILAEDPLYVETAEYKCMYMALWPDDPSGWVYRFNRTRNLIDRAALPEIHHRVIGLDLGWNDAKSIVDVGWNKHDKRLFILHAEKASHLHLDAFSERVKAVEAMHPVRARKVIDGANQDTVQELRKRYGLMAQDTEKPEKVANIRIMNTEIVSGRVMVVRSWVDEHGKPRGGLPLIEEWSGANENGEAIDNATPLVWDKRAKARRVLMEDAACPNHAADAALYAFRFAWNYMGRAETKPPVPGTEEAARAEIERYKAKLRKQLREDEAA